MNRTTAVIVTYNSEAEIGACLDSLPAAGCEAIVVDNASCDGTLETVRRRPAARIIANPWNRGFAAAANQGIAAAGTSCVLLLNPDASVTSGVDLLVRECEKTGVAAAGGKLIGPDGRPQLGFMVRRFPTAASLAFEVLGLNRIWPGNPVNRRYRCFDLSADVAGDVEQPAGAFLMLNRDAWRKLGGFDEAFGPLWFEDVDFLKRAVAAGLAVRYVPRAAAVHSGGHSAKRVEWQARTVHWYGNLLTYAVRHLSRPGVAGVCGALILGSVLRAIGGIVSKKSLKPISVYARVIRSALVSLFHSRSEGPVIAPGLAVQ